MERNNTDFNFRIKEFIKTVKLENEDWLRPNQRILNEIFDNKLERGVLVYWVMGSGKTRFAISCALASPLDCVVILNASLKADFLGKAKKIKEELELKSKPTDKLDKFHLISMNANNLLTKIEQGFNLFQDDNLDNKLIIVDEAHHLFNGITNGSKTAVGLYELIKNAKNCKIIFLTGTPITKNPWELSPCFNMLAGYALLPEEEEVFKKLYTADNPKLENRILGLTSYYGDIDPAMLPTVGKIKLAKTPMSNYQYNLYKACRDLEMQETTKKNKIAAKRIEIKGSTSVSSYRTKSRMQSNVGYTNIEKIDINDLDKHSPKGKAATNIMEKGYKEGKKGYLYSAYKPAGVLLIARILDSLGWKHAPKKMTEGKHYAIISGDVDITERGRLVNDVYNNDKNLKGELLAVLLITSTGAEGFDFKESRYAIAFEPFWHNTLLDQVFARGNRYGSHIRLPKAERTIQPIIFLSINPVKYKTDPNFKEDVTTDMHILTEATKNQLKIQEYLDLLKRTSLGCKICTPTNRQLFHPNMADDLLMPDPCVPPKELKLKVTSFMFEGQEYFYDEKKNVIKFDTGLNSYVYIDVKDPIYILLYNHLNTK
jgi:hypothetical protein